MQNVQKFLFSIGRFYARGRIIRLDELSSVVRLSSRTTEDSSSRRVLGSFSSDDGNGKENVA